ncbi:copper amine oxidase N-terminal domain-containing protein [bacterium LRH843]|nr:copper amine oxidase N-terminal domain-containing protein [bacterium LRH843]
MTIALLIPFLLINHNAYAATTINVNINGQTLYFDQPPIIEKGRVMVPMRTIFEVVGAKVEWSPKTQTVKATKGNTIILLPLNSKQATINGTKKSLDVPAKSVGGRTLVPLRFVSEALGSTVEWKPAQSLVDITYDEDIPAPNLDNAPSSIFHGTIFINPDIITENDPSSFVDLAYMGRGNRVMYDRRVGNWIEVKAFLFNASYSNGNIIEIQVNPEFQSFEKAQLEAIRFAKPIGQLPAFLRERVFTVWIHRGDNPFGGGNNNILIHTDQADKYISQGILEETIFHEATHTSLDPIYSENNEWIKAQHNDGKFISSYAKEEPSREDLAESLLPYFALKYRSDRLSQEMINTISKTIPHRIEFFEQQNFDFNNN